MTTQALPSFDRALADQVQHTRNAQALADDYKHKLDATRAALHEALETIQALYELKRDELAEAHATIAALERRLAEAQQGLTVAEGG